MSNVNILFYSNKNKNCQSLLKLMQIENMLHYFKCINIDENMDKIPSQIKSVPTAVISSLNKILVGNEIFAFINNIRINHQNMAKNNREDIQINQINQQNQLNQQNNKAKENNLQSIIGYIPNEMNGFSDKYAYRLIDNYQQHNFVQYNETPTSIVTGKELNKIKVNEQQKYLSELESIRKNQEKEFQNMFDVQRQNTNLIAKTQTKINEQLMKVVEKHKNDLFNEK